MQKYWKHIYYAVGASCIYAGYASIAPERSAKTNVDWIFTALAFVGTCLFPLLAISFSRHHHGIESFPRPSMDRAPLGWWSDPLQSLRVSLVGIVLTLLGSLLALPGADVRGIRIIGVYCAMASGFFIGEKLVYRIYKDRSR